jgi:DNA-binding NtrC family response regulator
MRRQQSSATFTDLFAVDFGDVMRDVTRGHRRSIVHSVSGLRVVTRLRRPAAANAVVQRSVAEASRTRSHNATKRESTLAFLKIVSNDDGKSCVQLLRSYPWPGNLRQLSNVVLSGIALTGERCVIEPDHLPQDFVAQDTGFDSQTAKSSGGASQLLTLDEAQNELIERTIRACHGNRSAAARTLRISRGTLYNKLKRR